MTGSCKGPICIPSRGSRNTPSHFMPQKPIGSVSGSHADFTLPFTLYYDTDIFVRDLNCKIRYLPTSAN